MALGALPVFPAPPPVDSAEAWRPLRPSDFTIAFWPNGWRKYSNETSRECFAIQTGLYALTLDLAELPKAGFSPSGSAVRGLQEALSTPAAEMALLPPASLEIVLEQGGKRYRATTCKAGQAAVSASGEPLREAKQLSHARLWESGRFLQHFDFLDLVFQDGDGARLPVSGGLELAAWPGAFHFTVRLEPQQIHEDGPCPGIAGAGHCVVEKPVDIPFQEGMDPDVFSVECWVRIPAKFASFPPGWLLCRNKNEWEKGNYGFHFTAGDVKAYLNVEGGPRTEKLIRQKRGAFKPGAWNHLALTGDVAKAKFYVNGELQGSLDLEKPRQGSRGSLRIGGRADGAGKPVPGLYDEIRVWGRVLTPQEVASHFARPGNLDSKEGLAWETNFETAGAAVPIEPEWSDAKLRLSFDGKSLSGRATKDIPGKWVSGSVQELTLSLALPGWETPVPSPAVSIRAASGQAFPVSHDAVKGCACALVTNLKRSFPADMTNIRDYDEFQIEVDQPGSSQHSIPFLFDFRRPANITGLCPILCDAEGRPTGIPVQLSKNWHEVNLGSYLAAAMLLPARPGTNRFLLRIPYGHWGGVPSASHAQLSLVGYGGNGRWDQLAIGCWGETFCLDMDQSCVDVAITDVRLLMARNGLSGRKWGWTDAGWGGDWLSLSNALRQKLLFRDVKTAYLAHGPCLTEARYRGHYGAEGEVGFEACVETLRTDDHARTFHTLSYRFEKEVDARGNGFFRMGGTAFYVTPKIAFGNRAGLLSELEVDATRGPGEVFLPALALKGDGPWWIAFPGAHHAGGKNKDWGTGSRALVIRSHDGRIGRKKLNAPVIEFRVNKIQSNSGETDLDLFLVPPPGVRVLKPGDEVRLGVEWITLPRTADDYYGPNEAFRAHLAESPRSWKSAWREALGNDLSVTVRGGALVRAYPIAIDAAATEVEIHIKGGVGYVPLQCRRLPSTRFLLSRLTDGKRIPLDQGVHGADFWQADFDEASGTYRMTWNLPLDGVAESTWVLSTKQ